MTDKLNGVEFDINIDDNNCIRILSTDKYQMSEKLKSESTKFVSSKLLSLSSILYITIIIYLIVTVRNYQLQSANATY